MGVRLRSDLLESCLVFLGKHHLQFSGVPTDTMTRLIPALFSSSIFLLHCIMNSWHKGHPSERKKHTMDTPLQSSFPIKLFVSIGSPFAFETEYRPMTSRAFKAFALSVGFPDMTTSSQPQSSDTMTDSVDRVDGRGFTA